MTAPLDVVTGAFSFTGRHIAEGLLARGRRVRTLTRQRAAEHPLATRVEAAPLVFDDSVVESLRGADTLYNTYWVRFERGQTTFTGAVENTARLVDAARLAGVRRLVHISVANPDRESPVPVLPRQGRDGGGRPRLGPLVRDRQADARLRPGRHPCEQHRLGPAARAGVPPRRRRPLRGAARVRV